MEIVELIKPEQVFCLRAGTKTQLLQELVRRSAKIVGLEVQAILDPIMAREALGSTGIGEGVAVPHARIAGLDHFFALFARLERPINFDAVDAQPVDLVFFLLIPAKAHEEHLTALACIARRLRNQKAANQLRATCEPSALYNLLATTTDVDAA